MASNRAAPEATPVTAAAFSFDSGAPFVFGDAAATDAAATPLFTMGSPARADADSAASSANTRNPFAAEVQSSRRMRDRADVGGQRGDPSDPADDEEGEEGEDDEEGEDEEGEDEEEEEEEEELLDSDDEGDTPYPRWEDGPTTVACEQCGEFIPRTQLAQHETEVCSETPMECPFAHLHCGSTAINRRLLRAHIRRNPEDHVVWLMQKLEKQGNELRALTRMLQAESERRAQLERAVEGILGTKITGGGAGGAFDTPRRGVLSNAGGRSSKSTSGRGGGGGGIHFSPLPASYSASRSPPSAGRPGGAPLDPAFNLLLDKPLTVSENRWTPHSLPASTAAPTTPSLPKPLAGSGNVASEAQTRLKVAAGLLPASALQQFQSPSKPAVAAPATPLSPTTVPAGAAAVAASPAAPTAASASAPVASGSDDIASLSKQLKGVLNKLSASNLDRLSVQVIDILSSVQSAPALTTLVSMLFDKAVTDAYFSNIYAMLCADISAKLPPLQGNPAHAFRRFLLNQCQVEFERGAGALQRDAAEPADVFEQRQSKQKARMLGTIRFIGQLYLHDLILANIMTFCIMHLLPHLKRSHDTADTEAEAAGAGASAASAAALEQEQSVEAFASLLRTVGSKLDGTDAGRKLLDETVFPAVVAAEAQPNLPSRLRFMLADLRELRDKLHWQPRKAQQQTVATSAPQATQQQQQQTSQSQSRSLLGGGGGGGGGGGSGGGGGGGGGGRGPSSSSAGAGRGPVSSGGAGSAPLNLRTTIRVNEGGGRSVAASGGGGGGRGPVGGGGQGRAAGHAHRDGRDSSTRSTHPLDSRADDAHEYAEKGGRSSGAWVRGEALPGEDNPRARHAKGGGGGGGGGGAGGGGGGGGRRRR